MTIPVEIQEVLEADLKIGDQLRIKHAECSDGKSAAMSIKRVLSGYVFHCFRCGKKGFVGHEKLPAAQVVRMVRQYAEKPTQTIKQLKLPADCIPMMEKTDDIDYINVSQVPMEAYTWCWECGLTDNMMVKYELQWSHSMCRIIFPIYDTDDAKTLAGYIGRSPYTTEKRKEHGIEKYLLRKDAGFKKRLYYVCESIPSSTVVFVEDIASAIRVHHATGFETVALLNKFVGYDLWREYAGYKIIVWLDPDATLDAVQNVSRGRTYGNDVQKVVSSQDPKKYNDVGIRAILDGQTEE